MVDLVKNNNNNYKHLTYWNRC